jgi:hypothetical protein
MSNLSRRKGARIENDVAHKLNHHGVPARKIARMYQSGHDLDGVFCGRNAEAGSEVILPPSSTLSHTQRLFPSRGSSEGNQGSPVASKCSLIQNTCQNYFSKSLCRGTSRSLHFHCIDIEWHHLIAHYRKHFLRTTTHCEYCETLAPPS